MASTASPRSRTSCSSGTPTTRLSGSIGLKGNLFRRLLLDVNLLFALDENGLRDKVTPLIGLEFSF